ncbi:MAG TPA: substrate-binding domain-containing protein [Pseudomonadales bacterium]|nr:substrate-binding domain-containing protein [Pseudomonadales bacterium]
MARELFLLSAGAAKALVLSRKHSFEASADAVLNATFGAVGAMRDKWDAGARCDVVILSAKLLDELARDDAIESATRASLGHVRTGVAVLAGAEIPALDNADDLRRAFGSASALFLPDPERATAGIHCIDVLRRLGILATMKPRLRPFENGAAAMAELARVGDARALGCTQVTEILYTHGVALAGPLPSGFELNTEYAAAVTTRTSDAALARRFVALLGGAETLAARRAGGFAA